VTFHGRLRLFFAIIVIIPMLAIAAVVFSLTADSEHGKADAGLATGLSVAFSLYGEGRAAAGNDLRRVARDDTLKRALAGDDPAAATRRLKALVRADRRIVSARLTGPDGEQLARAGSTRGIAPFSAFLEGQDTGQRLGTLSVSVTDARKFVRSAARRTRLEFAALRGGKVVATTAPGVKRIPRAGDFEAGGHKYRGRRISMGKPGGAEEQIGAFKGADDLNSSITASRLLIASILVAFLVLALATSVFVVRALQSQVGQFLEAARRLGSGRFDQPVPIEGGDEFAQLGLEFNNMSKQLEANIREVEGKRREVEGHRRELEDTIRQIGKAIATGLDRQGIYELTVQTAVRACQADSGRAIPLDLRILKEARAGSLESTLVAALEAAERASVAVTPETGGELLQPLQGDGRPANGRGPTSAERNGVYALALPLQARVGTRSYISQVGLVSIARRERPFTPREAELLEYLGGQAAISIENADLHEAVQQQAITDELTGISNRREMRGALDRELNRRRRFDTPIAFVALDIDDFKRVNDTYGHPQGDEVLVQVARVLRELTRDIDEPGRAGGEEFGVVLPQTDLDGAARIAERMREAIEGLRVPRLGGGDPLNVTASFGVAAVPASATDKDGLLAAADAALFNAKRAGKNRVKRAPDL